MLAMAMLTRERVWDVNMFPLYT